MECIKNSNPLRNSLQGILDEISQESFHVGHERINKHMFFWKINM